MAATFALWAWIALAPPAGVDPDADPKVLNARAEAAIAQGRWLDAVPYYRAIIDKTGDERTQYALAEALRLGGECEDAIAAYDDFLSTGQSDAMRAHVEKRVRYCEAELEAEQARAAALAEPEPAPPPRPEPEPRPEPLPRWYQDPAGDALVAVGLGAVIGGGVVLALGIREGDGARDDASSDREFGRAIDRAMLRTRVGGVTLGLGGALLVGGIVRWSIVEQRRNRLDVSLRPGGISVSGRLPSLCDLMD